MSRLTTLAYIEKNDCYLMLCRNKKKDDPNAGKWIGVGGKLENGESPDECMLREVYEETGLTLTGYDFLGVITFVSDTWEDEYMFLYLAHDFTGTVKDNCSEGDLAWIAKDRILSLPLWEGDRIFLQQMLSGKKSVRMKLTYHGEKLVKADLNS